jgi:hypothetical protein
MDKFIMRKTKSKIQKGHVLVTQNDQSSQTTNPTQSWLNAMIMLKLKYLQKRKAKTRLHWDLQSSVTNTAPVLNELYVVKYYQMKHWSSVV